MRCAVQTSESVGPYIKYSWVAACVKLRTNKHASYLTCVNRSLPMHEICPIGWDFNIYRLHAGMCLELENAQESIASVLSQRAAAEADAVNARAAAGREISALTVRVEELAAHLEASCAENASLSARLEELAGDNMSLQVDCLPHFLYKVEFVLCLDCTNQCVRKHG